MQLAVVRHDVDSARHILSADCPIFIDVSTFDDLDTTSLVSTSVLEDTLCAHRQPAPSQTTCSPQQRRWCCALAYGPLEADSRARHEIMTLTVAALKNRRTQLVGFALRRLPSAKLLELGVSSHTPLDSNSLATYTALQECGIPVPRLYILDPRHYYSRSTSLVTSEASGSCRHCSKTDYVT
jgi:hypothetical protein